MQLRQLKTIIGNNNSNVNNDFRGMHTNHRHHGGTQTPAERNALLWMFFSFLFFSLLFFLAFAPSQFLFIRENTDLVYISRAKEWGWQNEWSLKLKVVHIETWNAHECIICKPQTTQPRLTTKSEHEVCLQQETF